MRILEALWNWKVSYILAIAVTETEESKLRPSGITYSDAGPRYDNGETRKKLRSNGEDSLPVRRVEGREDALATEEDREKPRARTCG